MDAAGNLVLVDADNEQDPRGRGQDRHVLRRPMTAGNIYTVAGGGTGGFSGDGGPAIHAGLEFPQGSRWRPTATC